MSDESLELAKTYMGDLLGNKLPPRYARLYSQYSRVSMNQPGLPTWTNSESFSIFDDAIRLIEIGLLASENNSDIVDRITNFRRAGELFEWLAHEADTLENIPTNLYAAACYQLANLPARASGLAERAIENENSSEILKKFLKADFPSLLQLVVQYWAEILSLDTKIEFANINDFIVGETIRSLGIICAEIRWGDQPRLEKALTKLQLIYKSALQGGDTYSWLLAYLCHQVSQTYIQALFRYKVQPLSEGLGSTGKNVLERYVRQNYTSKQSLAWASQIRGIERLIKNDSFVLCTPTASGKTAVAELAILQSLFSKNQPSGLLDRAPIVLYLVPSRALAFQLEAKLAKVVDKLSDDEAITVTGLYGGTDWGPTDAWLTANDRTILICTYEKAEALIRFLGVLFISRVSLVVIDEAHLILYDNKIGDLLKGDNRSFRLETLAMRLLNYVTQNTNGRAIALSAAAFGAEKPLSGWVSGDADAIPEKVNYRSTRQLIGRLVCKPSRKAEIHFDIMDGESLEFNSLRQEEDDATPYIPSPFPPFPATPKLEKDYSVLLKMYVFWASFCFATSDTKQSVLISVTQGLEAYSKALDNILENYWQNSTPDFFTEPTDGYKKEIWQNCLRSCEDYFGKDSIEYRLLIKGVVVHQGQIPGKISKWLLDVISERIVRIVLATSTLTDGVNLPFEVILIPRLERQGNTMSLSEFENLIGRAGRPGFSVEGKSLVIVADENLFEPYTTKKAINAKVSANKHFYRYLELKKGLLGKSLLSSSSNAQSSLITLLETLESEWKKLSSAISFEEWLEITAPLGIPQDEYRDVHNILDVLDGALLPIVSELEQISLNGSEPNALEQRLRDIWGRTFAKYASAQEAHLESLFVKRGIAISKIYEQAQRRQIYSTSLQPKYADNLLALYPTIKQEMSKGFNYWAWTSKEKFEFIKNIVNQIGQVEKFKIESPGASLICTWDDILYWWVDPINAPVKPEKNISAWLKYIYRTFVYQISWGLGSVLGLAMNEANEGQIAEFNISDWPRTNLPWVIFWAKELLHWGTLDPVASYLLSKGMEVTRSEAELFSKNYYDVYQSLDANDLLNPTTIREWASGAQKRLKPNPEFVPPDEIKVVLLRDFTHSGETNWRVIPFEKNGKLIWIDVAGYPLATSEIPKNWKANFMSKYDFILSHREFLIKTSPYI